MRGRSQLSPISFAAWSPALLALCKRGFGHKPIFSVRTVTRSSSQNVPEIPVPDGPGPSWTAGSGGSTKGTALLLLASEHFEGLVQMMMGDEAPQSHGELEEAVVTQGNELLRQLLQARYDLLFERERAEFARVPPAEGVEVRARVRHLEMQVGRVAIWRHGVTASGESAATFPMDERLNLPEARRSKAVPFVDPPLPAVHDGPGPSGTGISGTFWTGSTWSTSETAATCVVPASVGELSVVFNTYLQQYIMLYINTSTSNIEAVGSGTGAVACRSSLSVSRPFRLTVPH